MTPPNESLRRVTDGLGDPDCPQCHGLGYLRDDAPVGHPNFGRLTPCACQLENMQRQKAFQMRQKSNTDALAGKTFDNFQPDGIGLDEISRRTVRAAYELAKAFAEHPQNWLCLVGTYGCGKTHLAAAIANHCLARGKPVLFLNTPDLLDYLRETFSPDAEASYNERFEEIRATPILILDDLGTESPTNWAIEKLYQVLNYRYNAKLPTVITTNRDMASIDQRIASRLSDLSLVRNCRIVAPDFRAQDNNPTADISSLKIHELQTFETFDPRADIASEERKNFLNAIRAAQEFAHQPKGWLLLLGTYGSGKTHLAAAIANERTHQGGAVIFTTYYEINELLRTAGNREADERNARLLEQVRSTELLVVDDLPSLSGGPTYYRDRFFQILSYRFDAQLPTVFTTAAEEKDLDLRLKSRLFYSELCQVHVLKAPPYRGKKKAVRRNPKSQ